jgi:hypothetical protein
MSLTDVDRYNLLLSKVKEARTVYHARVIMEAKAHRRAYKREYMRKYRAENPAPAKPDDTTDDNPET